MKWKGGTERVSAEERLFRVIISQFRAEERVPGWLHQVIILSNFLVYFLATCSSLLHLFFPGLRAERIAWEVLVVCTVYLFLQLGLYLFLAIAYGHSLDFNHQPPLVIKVSCLSGLLFKKAVYPLLVWSFMTLILIESTPLVWGLGISTLIIGTVMAFLFLMLMFNKMPSGALIACIENSQDYILYFVLKAAIVLSVIANHQKSSSVSFGLSLTTTSLISLQLGYSLYHHRFWNPRANLWLIQLSFFLLVSNIWGLVLASFSNFFLLSGYLLSLSLSFKLAENIVSAAMQVDFFSSAYSPHRRVMGLVSLERLFALYRRRELHGLEVSQFNFYRGVLENHLLATPGLPSLESLVNNGDKLVAFLVSFVEGQAKDEAMLCMLPKLILLSLVRHLPLWRKTMKRLKEKIGESLRGRLELFHLQLLMKARSETIYLHKKQELGTEYSLRHLYSSISQLSAQNAGKDMIDLALPFAHKALFLELIQSMSKLVDSEAQVFSYLAAEEGTNALSANQLFELSGIARDKMLSFDVFIDTQLTHVRFPPSYFFPPLYLYHALLRHNSSQAKKTLHLYQTNVGLWENMRNRFQSIRLDAVDANAAVLEIALEGRVGRILSATSQSEEYLGTPSDGSLEGHDIHELFIEQLRNRHERMIQEFDKLESILGTCREFFLQTYNSELKEVTFCVKLLGTTDGGFRGFSAIKPIQKVKCHLVVLSEGLEVMQAENAIWQTLAPGSTTASKKRQVKYVGEFTMKLPPAIDLFKIALAFDSKVRAEGLEHVEGSPFSQLSRCLGAFLRLNDQDKMVYSAESRSKFYSQLRGSPMTVRVKLRLFDGLRLTKLFISFGSSELNNAMMNRDLSKSFVAIDNKSQISSFENIVISKKSSEVLHNNSLFIKPHTNKFMSVNSTHSRGGRMSFGEDQDDLDIESEASINIEFVFAELKHIIALIDKDLYQLIPDGLKYLVDEIRGINCRFEDVFTSKTRLLEKLPLANMSNFTCEKDPDENMLVKLRSNMTALSPALLGLTKNLNLVDPSASLRQDIVCRVNDSSSLQSKKNPSEEKISPSMGNFLNINTISIGEAEIQLKYTKLMIGGEDTPFVEESNPKKVKVSAFLKYTSTVNSSGKLIQVLKPVFEDGQENAESSNQIEKESQDLVDGTNEDKVQHREATPYKYNDSSYQMQKVNLKETGSDIEFVDRKKGKKHTIISSKNEALIKHDLNILNLREDSVDVGFDNDFFWMQGGNSSVASLKGTKNNQDERKIHQALSSGGQKSRGAWLVLALLAYPLILLLFWLLSLAFFSSYSRKVTELCQTQHKLSQTVEKTISLTMLRLEVDSDQYLPEIMNLTRRLARDLDFHMQTVAPGGDFEIRTRLGESLPNGITRDGVFMAPSWYEAFEIGLDSLLLRKDEQPTISDLVVLQTQFLPRVFIPLVRLTEGNRRDTTLELSRKRDQTLLGLSLALGCSLIALLATGLFMALSLQNSLAEVLTGYTTVSRENLTMERETLMGAACYLSLNLYDHKKSFIYSTSLMRPLRNEGVVRGESHVGVFIQRHLIRAPSGMVNGIDGVEGSKIHNRLLQSVNNEKGDRISRHGDRIKPSKKKRPYHSLEIKARSIFPSIRWFFYLSLGLLVILLVGLLLTIFQSRTDQKLADYLSFNEEHSYALNNYHAELARVYLMSPVASPTISDILDQHEELRDPRILEHALDLYISLWEVRRDLITKMSSQNLARLLSEDCCNLFFPISFPGGKEACRNLHIGSPSQGFLPYIGMQARMLTSLLGELKSPNPPSLNEWWVRPSFKVLRETHLRIIAAIGFAVTAGIKSEISSIEQLQNHLIGNMRLLVNICLIVVVVSAPLLLMAGRSDHKVARHLFVLLAPRTILNNAQLMAMFKRAFKYLPRN